MSIPSAFRYAAFAAALSWLGLVAPASVRAQAYAGMDCSNPDFFQDCKYYSDVYGYPAPGYSSPYYAYGFPVGADVIVGGVTRGRVFHRRQPFVRFRGGAVHSR
jgi:hypothetical protein